MANIAKITEFGIQPGTTKTINVKWSFSKKVKVNSSDIPDSNGTAKETLKEFKYEWNYYTGDGIKLVGSHGTQTGKTMSYGAPENATTVKFRVKPISKTYTTESKRTEEYKDSNGKKKTREVKITTTHSYWKGEWSPWRTMKFTAPSIPPVPTVELKRDDNSYFLTARVDVYDSKAEYIEFVVVQNNTSVSFCQTVKKVENTASVEVRGLQNGSEYKVKCRAKRTPPASVQGIQAGEYKPDDTGWESDYTEYSSPVYTPPNPTTITHIYGTSPTSVRLTWNGVMYATSYKVEYTTNPEYFDTSSSNVGSTEITVGTEANITGLESGKTHYFRVLVCNGTGESQPSEIVNVTIGEAPAAPTTWSLLSTAKYGERIPVYWVHNTKDSSKQRKAQICASYNGIDTYIDIDNPSFGSDNYEENLTSEYPLDTTPCGGDGTIKWKVRTMGIMEAWSPWSIERSIKVYVAPEITINSNLELGDPSILHRYPMNITLSTNVSKQKPISYSLFIIANQPYCTVDESGQELIVSVGDMVFRKNYDVNDASIDISLTPGDVNLANGLCYTIVAAVTTDAGLTDEKTLTFVTSFEYSDYKVDAELMWDNYMKSASIRPWCDIVEYDDNDEMTSCELAEDVSLAVYRREPDGSFTLVQNGIPNDYATTIIDPHPSLDYMRYRVVATNAKSGEMEYDDIPMEYVGEKSIIIQWNESWSNYNMFLDRSDEELVQASSLLMLPFNIDINEEYSPDVKHVEYIGRKNPVGYFGTQQGVTANWKTDIIKSDTETLNLLRRLAVYKGTVYVREPSGVGYNATIKVSMSQTHCQPTIPVNLSITKVEGGV